MNDQTLSIIWLITLATVILIAVFLSIKSSYELEANCKLDDMKARSSEIGENFYIEGEASCEIDVSGEVPIFLLYLQNKEVIAWLSNYQ
jgi:hypothetical protein